MSAPRLKSVIWRYGVAVVSTGVSTIITILLGIAGSFIANYIGRAAGWYGPEESAGFIASILGAVILLAGYRLIAGRRPVV